MADSKNPDKISANDPVTPEDYNPTHGGDFPHGEVEISGEKEVHLVETPGYEDDVTGEDGQPVGMRRTGEFIVPDENNITGEGWTLPTRAGGGWDKALDTTLEEQIEEPDTPNKTNLR